MRFQILIFDGFDELDAIAPYEVLQDAVRSKRGDRVELVTVEAAVEVTADHGLKVRPSGHLDLDKRPDVLIVPGGGWIDRSSRGAYFEARLAQRIEAQLEYERRGTVWRSVA